MVVVVLVVWCVGLARVQPELAEEEHFVHIDSGRL